VRLTREEHPESIKRYRHVKPALRAPRCYLRCPGTTHTCSLEKGHRGPHVAHGLFSRVVAVWDVGAEGAPRAAPARVSPKRPRRKSIGTKSRSPSGFVEELVGIVRHAASSLEELAWLTFFIAFVAFAVGGFLLIYLG
jgi:hypothetical protein